MKPLILFLLKFYYPDGCIAQGINVYPYFDEIHRRQVKHPLRWGSPDGNVKNCVYDKTGCLMLFKYPTFLFAKKVKNGHGKIQLG
jgi:hypothetical protein